MIEIQKIIFKSSVRGKSMSPLRSRTDKGGVPLPVIFRQSRSPLFECVLSILAYRSEI